MGGQVLRVGWYRFRATWHNRWGGYLTLVVLVALMGGLSMAALAGARRTQSSFTTFLASTNPSDITVPSGFDDPALGLQSGYNPEFLARIGHLPDVERAATYVGFDGNIATISGIHLPRAAGESPPVIEGSFDGEFATQDRVTVVKGGMYDPASLHEA